MKIPKKLKIGAHTFTIKMVTFGKDETMGECDNETNEIKLSKHLKGTQLESTLFHEIFHAMNWSLTEIETESLSQQIYQVLKDNNLLK